MTKRARSLTPTSDALSASQDAMAEAFAMDRDDPARLPAILAAYRDERAEQMNALMAGQASILRFLEQLMQTMNERFDDRFNRVHHELKQIDAHLDQTREAMADQVQVFIFKFEEQFQIHANEIGSIKNRVAGLEQDVESIKRQLAALQDVIEGGP